MSENLNSSKNLNCKVPVLIFSIAALFFNFLRIATNSLYGYRINVLQIIYFIAYLTPSILLIIYAAALHKHFAGRIILPFAFFITAFPSFIYLLSGIGLSFNIILEFFLLIFFTLAGFSVLFGFGKKAFPIVAVCLSITFTLISFFSTITSYARYFSSVSGIIVLLAQRTVISFANTFFNLAILYLVAANDLPCIFTKEKRGEKTAPAYNSYNTYANTTPQASPVQSTFVQNPQQALMLLNENYKNGAISEDEYLTRRKEIMKYL